MEVGKPLPAPEATRPEVAHTGPAAGDEVHWEGLEQTDEFRELVRRRFRFVLPATIFFLVYYFLLPLGNGLAPDLMKTKVFGQVNIAYLFALSEFVMAWVLAVANTVAPFPSIVIRCRPLRNSVPSTR